MSLLGTTLAGRPRAWRWHPNMNDLSEELTILEKQWSSGKQDVPTARRILFVAWYVAVEPAFITGFDSTPPFVMQVRDRLLSVVEESAKADLESALVLGYMASFAPYAFGSSDQWLLKAQALLENAYRIAGKQNRRNNEISRIGYHLAIAIERAEEHQSSNGDEDANDDEGEVDETFFDCEKYDTFPEMFLGDTEYDHYFAHIFGCRK